MLKRGRNTGHESTVFHKYNVKHRLLLLIPFIKWRMFPCILSLLRVCNRLHIEFCQMISLNLEMTLQISFIILIKWWIYIYFKTLKQFCIPGTNHVGHSILSLHITHLFLYLCSWEILTWTCFLVILLSGLLS